MGIEAKEIMDAGELVPDDVMAGVVVERLAQKDVAETGSSSMAIPARSDRPRRCEIRHLAGGRRPAARHRGPRRRGHRAHGASGRHDDTEDAIRRRLDLYEETRPVLAWFAGTAKSPGGRACGTEDEVVERLVKVIEARTEPRSRHASHTRRDSQDAQGGAGRGRDARPDP